MPSLVSRWGDSMTMQSWLRLGPGEGTLPRTLGGCCCHPPALWSQQPSGSLYAMPQISSRSFQPWALGGGPGTTRLLFLPCPVPGKRGSNQAYPAGPTGASSSGDHSTGITCSWPTPVPSPLKVAERDGGCPAGFLLQVLQTPAWSRSLQPRPRPGTRAAPPTAPQVSPASACGHPGLPLAEAALTRVSPQGESPTKPSELQLPAWGPLLR